MSMTVPEWRWRVDAYNPDGPFRIFAPGRSDALAVCEKREDAEAIVNAQHDCVCGSFPGDDGFRIIAAASGAVPEPEPEAKP